jgi:hypothetical protein
MSTRELCSAAWEGDVELVKRLMEALNQEQQDLVNTLCVCITL